MQLIFEQLRAGGDTIQDLSALRVVRHGDLYLATRAWELRQNFTVSDAMYLALAEALDATVITWDGPFGATHRRLARIEVIRPAGH